MPSRRSLSEVRFAALLVYGPDGTQEMSRRAARAVTDIKNCLPDYIERIGERFDEAFRDGRFGDFLGDDVLLVPVPRSAPFKSKDAAWPARRICDASPPADCAPGSYRCSCDTPRSQRAPWCARVPSDPGHRTTRTRSGVQTCWRSRRVASRSSTTSSPEGRPSLDARGSSRHGSPTARFVVSPWSGR